MTPYLQSLSAEPLIYMLIHSGMFVAVFGSVFFLIGLLFGRLTWGRYKRKTRELHNEAEALKEEIGTLKRKIGDHSIKSGPGAPMMTETIHMPKKEVAAADPAELLPLIAEPPQPIETEEQRPITTQSLRPTAKPRPSKGRSIIKPKVSANAEALTLAEAVASAPTEEITTEVPSLPGLHISPLAAIISSAAEAKMELVESDLDFLIDTVPIDNVLPSLEIKPGANVSPLTLAFLNDTVPINSVLPPLEIKPEANVSPLTLPELPPAPPVPEVMPEIDPQLGPVYKTRPANANDLTALKGIAKVLEQRLHELGIYTWNQIASWNEGQIKEFSSRLAFKDRIQRENWVEQAQQLVAKSS